MGNISKWRWGQKRKEGQPQTGQASGVVGFSRKRPNNKKLVLFAVAGLVVVSAGMAVILQRDQSIKIGDFSISKDEIDAAVAAQKRALLANGFSEEEANNKADEARQQLILLAALKTEANKRSIDYSRSTINSMVLRPSFEERGGEQAYFGYMQQEYGWNRDDVYRIKTIEYLKEELAKFLIAKRTYSMTFVRWDNINLYNQTNGAAERVYKEKEALLNTKYLPLYQQNKSVIELNNAAEMRNGMSQDEQIRVTDETGGVPINFAELSYDAENSADRFQKYEEGQDMAQVLASIQNVGDYVGPVKTNMGILGIIRLEKSEGGEYASWEALTAEYESRSNDSNLLKSWLSDAGDVIEDASSPFMTQKAMAQASNCLSTHRIFYWVIYRDQDTGAPIASASNSVTVNGTRSRTLCDRNAYTGAGWSVTADPKPGFNPGNRFYQIQKTFSTSGGSLFIEVDCNGPEWNINSAPPNLAVGIPGYTYQSTATASGNQFFSSPFPWYPGINGVGGFLTYVNYKKNVQPVPRTFTVNPVIQAPLLTPDNESANSVTFSSGVDVNVSSGSALVRGGSVTRRYEIRRLNGAVNPLPSPGTQNRDLSDFTYPPETRSGLSLQAGDQVCEISTVQPSSGQVNADGTVISGGGSSTTDEKCARVVNKPYVSFFGNDVRAGGAFEGGNCSTTAGIATFYNVASKRGAGVQLAAMALGTIDQFASANMRSSAPTGLTFANTAGTFGGNFGASYCIRDFWSQRPASISNTTSIDLGTLPDGNYAYRQSGTSPVVISAATISNRIGVYVDGDVVVRGKISYANVNSWGSVADIPGLRLVVRGNISIDSSVGEIDGTYIAQPTDPNVSTVANGGRFYTCTAADGTIFTAGDLVSRCSSRLIINGSVIAQQVKLQRTIDSLRNAVTGESAATSRAAEVFRFSPEAYLAPLPGTDLTNTSDGPRFDYYTALPPVL